MKDKGREVVNLGKSPIILRARKGLCECGHLRWKEHQWYRIGKNAELECVGCKVEGCRCEKYQPQQDRKMMI